MSYRLSLFLCSIAILAMPACSPLYNHDGKPHAHITFEHVRAIPVYVASYESHAEYNGKLDVPEDFMFNPATFILNYLKHRFEPAGQNGKLSVFIRDVSVSHQRIKPDRSFPLALGFNHQDEYIVKATLDVTLLGMHGGTQNRILTLNRVILIAEHMSLVDRERLQMQALNNMVNDLDGNLRGILNHEFQVLGGTN